MQRHKRPSSKWKQFSYRGESFVTGQVWVIPPPSAVANSTIIHKYLMMQHGIARVVSISAFEVPVPPSWLISATVPMSMKTLVRFCSPWLECHTALASLRCRMRHGASDPLVDHCIARLLVMSCCRRGGFQSFQSSCDFLLDTFLIWRGRRQQMIYGTHDASQRCSAHYHSRPRKSGELLCQEMPTS